MAKTKADSLFQTWAALLAVSLGIFAITLDGSMMPVAIGSIVDGVNTEVGFVQAAMALHSLVMAASYLAAGKLADRLGEKRIFVTGAVIFAVGTVIAAVSPSIWVRQVPKFTNRPATMAKPSIRTTPSTGKAERVEVAPSPPTADVEQSKAEVEDVNRALDEMAAQRRQDEADRLAEKQSRERRQTKCEESKSRLSQLEVYPPNRRPVVYPDGASKRISWGEMQGLIESARLEVGRNCREE